MYNKLNLYEYYKELLPGCPFENFFTFSFSLCLCCYAIGNIVVAWDFFVILLLVGTFFFFREKSKMLELRRLSDIYYNTPDAQKKVISLGTELMVCA